MDWLRSLAEVYLEDNACYSQNNADSMTDEKTKRFVALFDRAIEIATERINLRDQGVPDDTPTWRLGNSGRSFVQTSRTS
jgi:hypothetical protein